MKRYVLDTNLYIRADRDAGFAEDLERFVTRCLPSIHLNAVVVQEMLAGAVDDRRAALVERSLVRPFERRGRVVTPSFEAWKRAGALMGRLVQRGLMSPGAFARSFPNDCLLATSCREAGLTLITENTNDFTLIRRETDVEVVEPWPE